MRQLIMAAPLLMAIILPFIFSDSADAASKAECTVSDYVHLKEFKHYDSDGTDWGCGWVVEDFLAKNTGYIMVTYSPNWVFMK